MSNCGMQGEGTAVYQGRDLIAVQEQSTKVKVKPHKHI